MDKNIIIDIPFNIDLTPYQPKRSYIYSKLAASYKLSQTEEWIDNRLLLCMKYTVTSIINQTCTNYTCLLRCSQETQDYIHKQLEKYNALPKNIIFTSNADEIIDNSMKKCGQLYHAVIDSDNMYDKDYIKKLNEFEPLKETRSIICQEGYVYDVSTNRIAEIYHKCPSFYAAVYDRESFAQLYDKRRLEIHWKAARYAYQVMPGRNYCICTHKQNVDNKFDLIVHKHNGRILDKNEKMSALKKWNLTN